MANLITGLFDNESAAENTVAELKQNGYSENEISIVMKDRAAAADFAAETGSRTMEGVGAGAAIGGTMGAVLAGLLAVGSIAVPGIGLLAAGPLAAMVAGAGAGGLAGSLVGWLVGAGIPNEVAPYYERGLQEGGLVVAVACHPGDEAHVQNILHNNSVAYSGYNTASYVTPVYASRYNDLTPPTKVYDADTTNGYHMATNSRETARTVNAMDAEQRSADRTAEAHAREARREMNDTTDLDRATTAVENAYDSSVTGARNEADRIGTGVQNNVDRVTNP